MKDSRLQYFFLLVAIVIKFALTLVLLSPLYAFLYAVLIGLFSYCLFRYKLKMYNYIVLLTIDFLMGFVICEYLVGINIQAILFSILYFVLSGFFVYYLLFEDLTNKIAFKTIKLASNEEIDKGLKALENDDYDKAITYFKNAIKENKTNYLGYMGMCNTLSKLDKKDIKKLKYYKKKCIKYAPKNLKESIDNKY